MNDRMLSLLGICRRAGKLKIGAQSVIDSISSGKASLVIMAKDFSSHSAKPVVMAAEANNIKTLTINRSKDNISPAVGRLCGVAVIEDEGFANKITELNENESGGELDG